MMAFDKSFCVLLVASVVLAGCSGGNNQTGTGVPNDDVTNVNGSGETVGNNTADPERELPLALSGSPMLNGSLNNAEWQQAEQRVQSASLPQQSRGGAKNVILFVGDGMGITTSTAARILDGQFKGQNGEENFLAWGVMPFVGLSKTYNVDAQTADSAGTMTAMMTGIKTDAGVIGVDEDVVRSQCLSQAGNELIGALELAEIAGMSTGIVSTARITHATPAAAYAKSVERGWENDAVMPADAKQQGCEDIASQLINFEQRLEARYPGLDVDGMEVAMGGGRRNFLPDNPEFNSNDTASGVEGARTDGVDLTALWQSRYPQGVYVTDQAGFDAINGNDTQYLLGLFDESHMEFDYNRSRDLAGEPSLAQMTSKAIDVLNNNERGYFLSVEAGRIDHGHHAGSAYAALTDTIAFSEAVQAAMDATNPAETLIIVTADHSHVFSVGGIAKRGNPILGMSVGIGANEPVLAADGLPYTTLAYANGLGFRNFGESSDFEQTYALDADPGRKDLSLVDTTSSGFHQEAMVPLTSETHGGEDVGVYAQGPGASLVTGTLEQNVLFHVMEFAADLSGRADAVLAGN